MTEPTFIEVIGLLKDQGIVANYEHPGYIAILLPDGTIMNVGDANETISADITDQYGGTVIDSAVSDFPADITTDAPGVARWIDQHYRLAVAFHHGRRDKPLAVPQVL